MGPSALQQSSTRQVADATLHSAAGGSTDTLSEVELLRTYLEPGCSITWHEAADKQSPAEVLQLMGKFSWFPNRTSEGAQSGSRQPNLPVCCFGTVPLQCSRLSIAMAASDKPVSPADVAFTLAKLTSLLLEHHRITQSVAVRRVRTGDPSYSIESDVHCSALKALTITFHSLVTEAVMLPTTSSSSSSPTGLRADDSAKRAQLQVAMAVARSGLLPKLESRLLLLLDLWDLEWAPLHVLRQHLQGKTGSKALEACSQRRGDLLTAHAEGTLSHDALETELLLQWATDLCSIWPGSVLTAAGVAPVVATAALTVAAYLELLHVHPPPVGSCQPVPEGVESKSSGPQPACHDRLSLIARSLHTAAAALQALSPHIKTQTVTAAAAQQGARAAQQGRQGRGQLPKQVQTLLSFPPHLMLLSHSVLLYCSYHLQQHLEQWLAQQQNDTDQHAAGSSISSTAAGSSSRTTTTSSQGGSSPQLAASLSRSDWQMAEGVLLARADHLARLLDGGLTADDLRVHNTQFGKLIRVHKESSIPEEARARHMLLDAALAVAAVCNSPTFGACTEPPDTASKADVAGADISTSIEAAAAAAAATLQPPHPAGECLPSTDSLSAVPTSSSSTGSTCGSNSIHAFYGLEHDSQPAACLKAISAAGQVLLYLQQQAVAVMARCNSALSKDDDKVTAEMARMPGLLLAAASAAHSLMGVSALQDIHGAVQAADGLWRVYTGLIKSSCHRKQHGTPQQGSFTAAGADQQQHSQLQPAVGSEQQQSDEPAVQDPLSHTGNRSCGCTSSSSCDSIAVQHSMQTLGTLVHLLTALTHQVRYETSRLRLQPVGGPRTIVRAPIAQRQEQQQEQAKSAAVEAKCTATFNAAAAGIAAGLKLLSGIVTHVVEAEAAQPGILAAQQYDQLSYAVQVAEAALRVLSEAVTVHSINSSIDQQSKMPTKKHLREAAQCCRVLASAILAAAAAAAAPPVSLGSAAAAAAAVSAAASCAAGSRTGPCSRQLGLQLLQVVLSLELTVVKVIEQQGLGGRLEPTSNHNGFPIPLMHMVGFITGSASQATTQQQQLQPPPTSATEQQQQQWPLYMVGQQLLAAASSAADGPQYDQSSVTLLRAMVMCVGTCLCVTALHLKLLLAAAEAGAQPEVIARCRNFTATMLHIPQISSNSSNRSSTEGASPGGSSTTHSSSSRQGQPACDAEPASDQDCWGLDALLAGFEAGKAWLHSQTDQSPAGPAASAGGTLPRGAFNSLEIQALETAARFVELQLRPAVRAFRGESSRFPLSGGALPVLQLRLLAVAMVTVGEALCAAAPCSFCCNNPRCTRLYTVSDAFALVRGKACVCGGCLGQPAADESTGAAGAVAAGDAQLVAARYCSVSCQDAHWHLTVTGHKRVCPGQQGSKRV